MGRKHVVTPGQRFGRGIVLEEFPILAPQQTYRGVRLRCDCGTVYEARLGNLLASKYPTRSCGCLQREVQERGANTTHGLSRHDGTQHPLYQTWAGMMTRCYNPDHHTYRNYGGRGITVWEPWHEAAVFITDIERLIGSRPDGMSLDRWPDNAGDYEPGNVRWATRVEQARNSRNFVDGTRTSPLYRTWWGLLRDRPDEVCERWHDLANFIEDVSPRPAGLRFHRPDTARLYGPDNFRWVTGAEQIEPARAARLSKPYPVKHGLAGKNQATDPLYHTWVAIRRTYPELLHEPWHDAQQFIRDVRDSLGDRPERKVFRRIDPDGRFEPGNIYWGPRGRPSRK